eukprot:CAMPEP_0172494508 /NCGR_PEP_ID=MMETSP1066-20121228/50001_1 /TAXON_ID=671091 /ORGANISM="Coscinodiscus wailesii, Strain CCMP2513" /LENGTH=146 /DNA_ID=CAMNT_0013265535 /DNA_START=110 /DNA_END=550 /DNA_ORIENTATION=+
MPSKTKTEDELADLKEAFSMFDTNGDGTIEAKELRMVMKQLGHNLSNKEVMEMIGSVDDNSDGSIDFDEFVQLMGSRSDPDQELREAFDVFDTDKNGSISRSELKGLMVKLGQNLSDAELDAMMTMVDSDGDGEISFEEFKEMMES